MKHLLTIFVSLLAILTSQICEADQGDDTIFLQGTWLTSPSFGPETNPDAYIYVDSPGSALDELPGVRSGIRIGQEQAWPIVPPVLRDKPSPMWPDQSDIVMDESPNLGSLNGLSGYFSSATGGFGFRFGYDRRVTPVTRLTAGMEFLTYGFQQALKRLGSDLPAGVTRVTLVSIPVGLQRQFRQDGRVVPFVGLGAGPYFRFDHQAVSTGYYPGGMSFSGGSSYLGNGGQSSALGLGIGLPFEGAPTISATLGGYVGSGLDIRVGADQDFAITLDGRYTLARFTEALGFSRRSQRLLSGHWFRKVFLTSTSLIRQAAQELAPAPLSFDRSRPLAIHLDKR